MMYHFLFLFLQLHPEDELLSITDDQHPGTDYPFVSTLTVRSLIFKSCVTFSFILNRGKPQSIFNEWFSFILWNSNELTSLLFTYRIPKEYALLLLSIMWEKIFYIFIKNFRLLKQNFCRKIIFAGDQVVMPGEMRLHLQRQS